MKSGDRGSHRLVENYGRMVADGGGVMKTFWEILFYFRAPIFVFSLALVGALIGVIVWRVSLLFNPLELAPCAGTGATVLGWLALDAVATFQRWGR